MTDPILAVDGLTKRFGGLTAVDDVTLEIQEGTITGLIGPNGAGKTTLFNLISGFEQPDAGTIHLNGKNVADVMEPDDLERSIEFLASGIVVGLVGGASTGALGVSGPALGAAALLSGGVGGTLYTGRSRLVPALGEHHSRPYQVARNGLVRTFQITRELDGMSVLDNMMLAPQTQVGEGVLNALFRRGEVSEEESALRARAEELLAHLELDHLIDEPAANLSGGQRKLLELGRVLMADPDIVLLDEPVAGVNPTLTGKLTARIEDLKEEGYTFFIIEHDMDVIMDLSESLIVMNNGRKILEGSADEVRASDEVVEAYLGS